MLQVEPVIKIFHTDHTVVSTPSRILPDGHSSKSPKFNEIRARYGVLQSPENDLQSSHFEMNES